MSTKQKHKGLRLILGDQLNPSHSWFKETDWLYVMMEIKPESEYVTHHIQKIVGIFQAMRSFASSLSDKNIDIKYYRINDSDNHQSFKGNIESILKSYNLEVFEYQEPDEWRLDEILADIKFARMVSSEHFLSSRTDLEEFFNGKKTYLMENFYRYMRRRHDILMDDREPHTGKWNYDKSNRKKLPKSHETQVPFAFSHDVSNIYKDITIAGLSYIGNINSKSYIWPKNTKESLDILNYFLDHLLVNFGDYQDAMSDNDWSLYHSRISFSMNLKMISPLEVIQKVEKAYFERPEITINSAEGFIRQVLGWREYMRGLYWAKMPAYKESNFLENKNPLPSFYWTGNTRMNCLSKAITQSLDHAYAHHIQRLMITGNFALLSGCDPDEVDLWYLGIYIDAFEWVEITNTRGMSQYADGGIVATKPYVSSASYIHKMGDHCVNCHYDYKKKAGDRACPFNSLYWNFIDQHQEKFRKNPRMGMMLALWNKMDSDKKVELLHQATFYLEHIDDL